MDTYISSEGIKPLQSKVNAIIKMPPPTNVKELQSFLGGINFYARCLVGRAKVAEPLHRLLDKEVEWSWQKKHQETFMSLKKMVIN